MVANILWGKRIVLLAALSIFFFLLLYGVRIQSHSWYFQDEGEHTVVGWMQYRFGKVLYLDLSTNHQPIPILVGQFISAFVPYDTFFQYIYRLRVVLWMYAFCYGALLVWRFRIRGLGVYLLTYSAAHYFFGWHLLAESLAVPPVLWIMLSLREERQTTIDAIFFGGAIFLIAFSLLPLWPFLALSSLVYAYRFGWKPSQVAVITLLCASLILFSQIAVFGWFRETVWNNINYFIPYEAAHDTFHYLRLLFYPFFNVHLWYAVPLLIALIFVVWKHKRHRSFTLVLCALCFLLNLRTSEINAQYYAGFHLFPYVAGISFLSLYTFELLRESATARHIKWYTLGLSVYLGIVVISQLSWVLESRSRLQDYFIYYDTFQAYGTALKVLARPGDTLLTGPDGAGYMNMVADLPYPGLQHFHLEWAYRVPELRERWLKMMQTKPPTFIYFNLGNDGYSNVLRPLLKEKYTVLKRKDGTDTLLFMRTDAVPQISEEQWQHFEEQAFERIQFRS